MLTKGKGLIILCLALLLATVAFAQDNSLTVGTAKGAPGATGIEVTLTGAGPNMGDVAGINFAIQYDSTVLANPNVTLGDVATGFQIDQNTPVAGEHRALIIPPSSGITTFSGAGVIANISFDVANVAEANYCTDISLILDKGPAGSDTPLVGVSDDAGVSITDNFSLASGSIMVTRPGDLNSDGAVNFLDYSVLAGGWGTLYNFLDYSKLAQNWGLSCP